MFASRVRGNPTFQQTRPLRDAILAGTIEEGGTAQRHPTAAKCSVDVTPDPGAVQHSQQR